jgi:hypothetical protein
VPRPAATARAQQTAQDRHRRLEAARVAGEERAAVEARAAALRGCPQARLGIGPPALVSFVQYGEITEDTGRDLSIYAKGTEDRQALAEYVAQHGPRPPVVGWPQG